MRLQEHTPSLNVLDLSSNEKKQQQKTKTFVYRISFIPFIISCVDISFMSELTLKETVVGPNLLMALVRFYKKDTKRNTIN